MKHTPGPWAVSKYNHRIKIIKELDAEVYVVVCYLKNNHAEANARLIAAAPDLLEAARLGLDFAKIVLQDYLEVGANEEDTIATEVINKIEAAIQKAEGRE